MVGQKFDNLYVVDAPKMLETAGKDIVKDRGNQAYFIMGGYAVRHVVYNEFCQIKPISQWLDRKVCPGLSIKTFTTKEPPTWIRRPVCSASLNNLWII